MKKCRQWIIVFLWKVRKEDVAREYLRNAELLKNKYKIRKLIKKLLSENLAFFMKNQIYFPYLFIYYDRLLFNNTNNKD